MRYSMPTTKGMLFLTLVFFICHILGAQNLHLIPEVKSPNVANFETFGNVPVNLFTGTPNISIPIYTLQSGNIQVPISLSYHPSNVKPATQPGWVGFGWSLNPGGAITRKVNGGLDENYNQYYPNLLGDIPYYPYPYKPEYSQIIYGSQIINDFNDWNSVEKLKSYLIYNNTAPNFTDVKADEFSFNFLGYSGKFIYTGPGSSQGWKVVSDQNLKVEITGFLYYNDFYSIMEQYPFVRESTFNGVETQQSRFFKGFKITVPDGTQYEFGGFNGVELSSQYAKSHSPYSINTWLLTRITDVNNNIVEFKYKRTYPTCSLSFNGHSKFASINNGQSPSPFFWYFSNAGTPELFEEFSIGDVFTSELYGSYIWPLYLEKITSNNIDILFSSDVADCLVYTRPTENSLQSQLRTPNSHQQSSDDFSHVNFNVDNIQWEKLNKIEIIDKTILNYEPRELHEFFFEPDPYKIKRLTLNSYQRSGNNPSNDQMLYNFEYNDMSAYNDITCDGNYTDHWGYFNKIDAGGSVSGVYNRKKIDTTSNKYYLKGLLNRIKYPAGGYTTFVWEANDYSEVISTNRQQLEPVTGNPITGGTRIREINSFSELNELLTQKKYYYKKNFTKAANLFTLSSSGTLNVIPQYVFSFSERDNLIGSGSAYYEHGTFNSITDFSQTGQGSHIGYSEVTEENLDGSYTKYFFTSYGEDLHLKTHFDTSALTYAGFDPLIDRFMPHSSLELERGKEVGRYDYNPYDIIIKKNVTYYRDFNPQDTRFNHYIRRIPWHLTYSTTAVSLGLIASTKEYNYVYYPIKTETTTYDTEGNNPIVSTTEYAYNGSNQISEQKTISSMGNELKTTYIYPSDLSDSVSNERKELNYISSIIESKQFEDGIQTNLTRTDYIKSNGMFLPNVIKRQKGISDPMIIDIQVLRNNEENGNILEYSIPGGTTNVLIWGHGNQYPIAKIENASYSDVAAALGISISDLNWYNEHKMNELNSLRGLLPQAMITTYTYDVVYGIKSITDPGGKSTYYYYDDFGRLSYTRDNDGKILSYTEYHYKN